MHLDKHPILWQVYELAQAIEKCGASTQLTEAVLKASALGEAIEKLIDTYAGQPMQIDFTLHTREEVIGKIVKLNDPKLRPLIKWIAESIAFERVADDIRVCIANTERGVEATVSANQRQDVSKGEVNIGTFKQDLVGGCAAALFDAPDVSSLESPAHLSVEEKYRRISHFMELYAEREEDSRKRCPCEFEEVEPCDRQCSCRNPNLSGYCTRCTTCGSHEQQLAAARRLAGMPSPGEVQKVVAACYLNAARIIDEQLTHAVANGEADARLIFLRDSMYDFMKRKAEAIGRGENDAQCGKLAADIKRTQEATKSADKWPPLDPGTKVKTSSGPKAKPNDWLPECLASRQWGVKGTILKHHDSHGLSYEVQHEDGTVGHYDPLELEVLGVPQPLCQGVAERHLASEILEEAKRRIWRDTRGSDLTLNNAVAVLEGLKQELLQ